MTLPLAPPLEPMELRRAAAIPDGPQWQYEPKWDGFRAIAFRDGDEVYVQSKAGQPLGRYFPEIVEALRAVTARRFVLDGELIVPVAGLPSFDALLQRIHPAESRIERLARTTPAQYLVFDLLVDERGENLSLQPLEERRRALERFAERFFGGAVALSPATRERAVADRWFEGVGGALDGVVAKRRDLPYQSNARAGGVKIKRLRSADCVVGGYRLNRQKDGVGSLLLGLYDDQGKLDHVGFTSGLKSAERKSLLQRLRRLEAKPGFTGSAPGEPSRWRSGDEPWFPLEPVLVVEVQYDHVTGRRFRHGTKLLRWRPDKAPGQCTFDQLHLT